MSEYFISKGKNVYVYDQESFKVIQKIEVSFPTFAKYKDNTVGRQLKILNLVFNKDESKLAVLVGSKLFADQVENIFLFVFKQGG